MENLDEVIDAVKAWQGLPHNTRWLMIYDNFYDNPRLASNKDPTVVDITKYIPEVYQGSMLETTRSSEVEIGCYSRSSPVSGEDYCYAPF